MLLGNRSELDRCVHTSFAVRVDACRWESAALWLSAGDRDFCTLTDLEIQALNRLLIRRGLIIDAKYSADVDGPVSWRVRRLAI